MFSSQYMSCGHRYNHKEIFDIINATLENETEYELKCGICGRIWDLNECNLDAESRRTCEQVFTKRRQFVDDDMKNDKPNGKKTKDNSKSTKKGKKWTQKKTKKVLMQNGLVRFDNLGNTCFMNAALQTMLKIPGFVEAFFNDLVFAPKGSSPFTNSWTQFIKGIYTTNQSCIQPRKMRNALNKVDESIGNGEQQDSFYVISTVLQALDDELCSNSPFAEHEIDEVPSQKQICDIINNEIWGPYVLSPRKDDNSCIVRKTFDGIHCVTLSCCDCDYQYRKYETFRGIELPLFHKLIELNIKVYVPQINKLEAFNMKVDLTSNNTLKRLKYLISSKQLNDNNGDLDIKIGYIDASYNSCFKYLKDTDDCSKIPNKSELIALIYDGSQYIPRFNLICNENDKWVTHGMDLMTFTPFYPSNTDVLGKDIIEKESKICPSFVKNDYTLTVFYNHRVVHPNDRISIIENGSLLLIWVHVDYKKESPSLDTDFEFNESDRCIIQKALLQSNHSSNNNYQQNINNWMDAVSNHYNKLRSFNIVSFAKSLLSFLPGKLNENTQTEHENEMHKTHQVYSKLKKLSSEIKDIEKMANDWLHMRLSKIETNNYTSRRALDDITECLKLYEENEVSNKIAMRCLKCKQRPEFISRQVEVLQTPNILILHIDRYDDNANDDWHHFGKRDHLVKYPINDLRFKNDTYDLFGVVVHYGSNDGGHYVCYVKSLFNDEWHKMDDRRQPLRIYNAKDLVSNNATVLLYNKKEN